MANYHGPLYDRACSIFQRRVKQVYFQLNPFLERTNLKDDEAESYQPSSKFVIPLKSIVVCERFDSDNAKDWKVLNPGEFWEYLYSASWGDDCSLRVLEGELLELLKMILCVMEKNDELTSHNTFAYAKNKRKVTKCYVNSLDKKEEFAEETLLVEFIYYGVSEKKATKKKDTLVSWKDYKEMAAKAARLTKLVDIVELVESGKKKKRDNDFMSLIRAPKSTSIAPLESNEARVEALTAIKWQEGVKSSKRRSGVSSRSQQGPSTHFLPNSTDDESIPRESNASPFVETGSELLARMDEILFDTTKKVGRTRRNTTFFGGLMGRRAPPGEEFYINKLTPKHQEPFKACDYLREQKQKKITEREKAIEEVRLLNERMEENKIENTLEESRQSSDESYRPLLKVYDRKPSFGEFYKYLEEENKFDPRFKKGAPKKKKATETNKVKEGQSKLAVGAKKRSSIFSIAGKQSSVGFTACEEVKKAHGPKVVTDRQKFANEVGGVTDSEAAKRHCLQNTMSDHKVVDRVQITRPPPSVMRNRRPNSMFSDNFPSTTHRRQDELFYPVLPKITSPILEGTSPTSRTDSYTERLSSVTYPTTLHSKGGNKGPLSRATTAESDSDSDMESPYSDVDDENDDFHDTIFDTKKLNRKYSIEKIRAIKSKKEKKAPVLNILKKFCRVNRIMALASKPSKSPRKSFAEPRKSVADAAKAKQLSKTFGMFRRVNKIKPIKGDTKGEVGKLKSFEFLKHKDHKMEIPEVTVPNFDTCSIEQFKRKLLEAMNSFVIRKEMITSSYTFETVTTVTFTRPAAYVRMHQMPKDLE